MIIKIYIGPGAEVKRTRMIPGGTFLEVQRVGSPHSQIIPMSQILELEFGE